MAITIDWTTLTFSIPQADLTLVSGTLYEMDTETDFRQNINAIMAGEEGIVFEDPIIHNTEVTVAGTTFARTIEVINGYSLTFTPDSQWSVRLAGSNNNLFDVENNVLNQNQVQVIAQNSGGLISTAPLTADQDARFVLIEKLLRNKMITDPDTGVITVYDNDGSTPLVSGSIYEDKDAVQPYRGQGAERRERMT